MLIKWLCTDYLSNSSEVQTEATLQLAAKAGGWDVLRQGRLEFGQRGTAREPAPGAASGIWTSELEGCQQPLDGGEHFWHFPWGNAMCPTSDVGLQLFLFSSWSRASDKREQKKKENSSQPLKSVSEACLKGDALTPHWDASPVWRFQLAFLLALNLSCRQDYLPMTRIRVLTVGVKKEIWSCYSSPLPWFARRKRISKQFNTHNQDSIHTHTLTYDYYVHVCIATINCKYTPCLVVHYI